MRISDWSSDVCSSDLARPPTRPWRVDPRHRRFDEDRVTIRLDGDTRDRQDPPEDLADALARDLADDLPRSALQDAVRSEERRVGKECVSTCRFWWSPYP